MTYTEAEAVPVTRSEAVVVARDGTTLHVTAGPVGPAAPQRWFLQFSSPDGRTSLRAEWTRGASFAADSGAPVHLTVGTISAEAVLRGSQMSLVADDADIRSALDAVGQKLLRFDSADWPYRPDLADLRPTTDSFGQYLDCVSEVAAVGAGGGALAGGVAGSFAAGVGAVDGAFVGGLSGGALGVVGGGLGCAIGAVIVAAES